MRCASLSPATVGRTCSMCGITDTVGCSANSTVLGCCGSCCCCLFLRAPAEGAGHGEALGGHACSVSVEGFSCIGRGCPVAERARPPRCRARRCQPAHPVGAWLRPPPRRGQGREAGLQCPEPFPARASGGLSRRRVGFARRRVGRCAGQAAGEKAGKLAARRTCRPRRGLSVQGAACGSGHGGNPRRESQKAPNTAPRYLIIFPHLPPAPRGGCHLAHRNTPKGPLLFWPSAFDGPTPQAAILPHVGSATFGAPGHMRS
jgi:hypothetical protein